MGRRAALAVELAHAARDMRRSAALHGAIEHEIATRAIIAVGVIEKIMLDQTAPPAVRLDAAREFLDRSVGKPAIRTEITAPPLPDNERVSTVALDAVRREADQMQEVTTFVMRRIPFDDWPEHVREYAGEEGRAIVEA